MRWWDDVLFLVGVGVCAVLIGIGNARADVPLEISICTHTPPSWGGACTDPDIVHDTTAPVLGREVTGATASEDGVVSNVPIDPAMPLETPTGWTAPTPPSLDPVPPGTSSSTNNYYITGQQSPGSGFAAKLDACIAWVASLGAPWGAAEVGDYGGFGHDRCYYYNTTDSSGPFGGAGPFVEEVVCPAGYTGSPCTLSNAALVVKPSDGRCGVTRVSGAFVNDSNDPDCSASPIMVASGDTMSGSDTGIAVQVKINGDGSTTITDSRPSGDGNTQNTTYQLSAPGGGGESPQVVGYSRNWTEGSGTEGGAGAAAVGCGGPGEAPCKIDESGTPTNSGTMAAAGTALDTAISTGETGIATYGTSAARSDLGVTLSVSWPDVTCANPQFDVFGRTMTVRMCEYESDVNAVMSWLVYILGAFTVFGMIREVR